MYKTEAIRLLEEIQAKEDRTFLKYMLCTNALDNHFLKKKDLTDEDKKEISRKCEGATFEEVKELWLRYMGFEWKGIENSESRRIKRLEDYFGKMNYIELLFLHYLKLKFKWQWSIIHRHYTKLNRMSVDGLCRMAWKKGLIEDYYREVKK